MKYDAAINPRPPCPISRFPAPEAPNIVDAFDRGVTIKSSRGFWLAIPTPAAGVKGLSATGSLKRITPSGWERRTGMRLREDNQMVTFNAGLIGVLVLVLAAFELVDLHRWEETSEIACGLWLIASPYIFGYAGAGVLQFWHYGLGAVIVLLAAAEVWQDWRLNDNELARHGM
jgi:hypothetical protein